MNSAAQLSPASPPETLSPPPSSGETANQVAVLTAQSRRYRRGRIRQLLLVAGDVVTIAVPLVILREATSSLQDQQVPDLAVLFIIPLWLVMMHVYGLYPRLPRYVAPSTLNELPRLFHATLVTMVTAWIWLHVWGGAELGVPLSLVALTCVTVAPVMRALSRYTLMQTLGPERVLLVGTGSTTATVARALEDRHDIAVVRHVPLPTHWRRGATDDALVESDTDGLQHLNELVVHEHIDRILLSTRELGDSAVGDFLHWSRQVNVSMTVLPEHFDVVGVGATIDQVHGATVVSLQPPVLSRTARTMKRSLDILGATAGLILLAPMMGILMLAVRLDSAGPIFFRQERVGRRGKTFRLVKFRTMIPDADSMVERLMVESTDPDWLQIENDPRITHIGRMLRSTSLDELPQLWNVLVGHMSLVGPRPLSVRDDARVNGWGRGRLDITPGLTGLWQVAGRKSIPFEDMVKIDYLYVNNWSLWGDVKLLMQTLPVVIRRQGAR